MSICWVASTIMGQEYYSIHIMRQYSSHSDIFKQMEKAICQDVESIPND